MADRSAIEWTDATWNPITGCSVKSPGCTNCYAMRLAGTRLKNHPSRQGLTTMTKTGPIWNGKMHLNEEWLDQPKRWRRPRKIFVCAHGDLFHESVDVEWLQAVTSVMLAAPQHEYQILTKRPHRAWKFLLDNFASPPQNWLIGVSVEDQRRADERRSSMHDLSEEGWRTFVSYEPALGPVGWFDWEFVTWMISGGESGPNARPSHPDWHRSTRDWCTAHAIPYLFKQWGEWIHETQTTPHLLRPSMMGEIHVWPDDFSSCRVGKYRAGRLLDGREHNGFPAIEKLENQ